MLQINDKNSSLNTNWGVDDGNEQSIKSSSSAFSASRTRQASTFLPLTKNVGKQNSVGANARAQNLLNVRDPQHFESPEQLIQYLKKEQRKGIGNAGKPQCVIVDIALNGGTSLITCSLGFNGNSVFVNDVEGSPDAKAELKKRNGEFFKVRKREAVEVKR